MSDTLEEMEIFSPENIALLDERCTHCSHMVQEIKDNYEVQGGSSFYDITGNILGVMKNNIRYLKTDPTEEDYVAVVDDLPMLEKYLNFITSHSEVLQAEIQQRDGAFPEIRKRADELKMQDTTGGFRPVIYYINEITK